MRNRIEAYINRWKYRGYPEDIPDEVPGRLSELNLAPSYKSICLAILNNDHQMQSLGFQPKKSEWYGILKRIELEGRDEKSVRTRKERLRSREGTLPFYF